MTFYFVCYRGDSVSSISESDKFRGQVECGEMALFFFRVLLVVHLVYVCCYDFESCRLRQLPVVQ